MNIENGRNTPETNLGDQGSLHDLSTQHPLETVIDIPFKHALPTQLRVQLDIDDLYQVLSALRVPLKYAAYPAIQELFEAPLDKTHSILNQIGMCATGENDTYISLQNHWIGKSIKPVRCLIISSDECSGVGYPFIVVQITSLGLDSNGTSDKKNCLELEVLWASSVWNSKESYAQRWKPLQDTLEALQCAVPASQLSQARLTEDPSQAESVVFEWNKPHLNLTGIYTKEELPIPEDGAHLDQDPAVQIEKPVPCQFLFELRSERMLRNRLASLTHALNKSENINGDGSLPWQKSPDLVEYLRRFIIEPEERLSIDPLLPLLATKQGVNLVLNDSINLLSLYPHGDEDNDYELCTPALREFILGDVIDRNEVPWTFRLGNLALLGSHHESPDPYIPTLQTYPRKAISLLKPGCPAQLLAQQVCDADTLRQQSALARAHLGEKTKILCLQNEAIRITWTKTIQCSS